MRELPVSNCEKTFVLKCIKEGNKCDGSELLSYRPITLTFGLDYGYCVVCLGETKIMAQVTAEIDRPKENRAHEGNLGIFVEMSTMGSASLDPAKPGNLGVELQRMLERSILLTRAVDLEGLCVRVGEYAWNLSLRLQILSHDGNLLDCASIASLAALSHFKRPDVTVAGKDVTVHTFEEKHPVSLTINHQPFCVTYAFFDNGNYIISDPNSLEEKCADGKLMLVMNKHREICCTQMSGRIQISKEKVIRCTNLVAERVKELSELVKTAIQKDAEEKKNGKKSSTTFFSLSRDKFKEKCESNQTRSKTKLIISQEPDKTSLAGDKEPLDDEERSNRLCWLIKHGQSTASTEVENKVQKTDLANDVSTQREINAVDSESEEENPTEMHLA